MQKIEERIFEYTGYKQEDFSVCLGCKICASVCTLNDVGFKVNPQELLLSLFMGLKIKNHVLINLCTSCYRCTESCPWEIRIPELVRAIKEITDKEESFTKAMKESIRIFGRVYEPYVILRVLPTIILKGYVKYLKRWKDYINFHLPTFAGKKG
ncbi:MAG: (Fe-S)-binding protein [Desulfobacterota bacterium]|nr:(Fe-S)-binding protein [Thermodesulfobacteriota bacterium]MDW8002331.1 (Fe-S)-binding protein [Deltaproteobacteria bacterium]